MCVAVSSLRELVLIWIVRELQEARQQPVQWLSRNPGYFFTFFLYMSDSFKCMTGVVHWFFFVVFDDQGCNKLTHIINYW